MSSSIRFCNLLNEIRDAWLAHNYGRAIWMLAEASAMAVTARDSKVTQ